MRFKSHNGDSRRFMQIAASVLLLCFGSLIFSSFDQSSSHASTSTPRTRNLQTYINDASTSTPGTRNLQTYIDDEVSAADWPPSSIVDKVVDERNRVAIVAVNCAGLRFADNWANSLLTLGIKNFIMIPLDNSTEAMLNEIYPENTVPMLPGANDGLEKYPIYSDFGGYAFKELTSTRPSFIKAFLEKGYTVLYNDADMVWRGNLWDEVDPVREESTGNNEAVFIEDGSFWAICSCLIFMRPTEKNIRFLELWRDEILTKRHNNDQYAFNAVLQNNPNSVNWRRGDKMKFPSGSLYFKMHSEKDAKARENVLLVHANWMQGDVKKRMALVDSDNWHPSGKIDQISLRLVPCGEDFDDLKQQERAQNMAEYELKVKTERENLEREERELEQRKQAALKNGNGWDEKSNLEINVLR